MSDHMTLPSPDYRDDVPLDTPTLGLEELARAVEEHSNLAGAHVEDFIKNAMQMLEAVRSTQARNGNGGPPQQ